MRNRVLQLDLLRVIAVALVFGRHMPLLGQDFPAAAQVASTYWSNCGWIGVDLFFVLSGFLISGLLFREHLQHGRISVPRFYIRRGLKLYPSFWLMIATVIYIQYSNYNYALVTKSQVLSELLFFQSYFPGLLDHTWSLGVEEHFYILLPLLLLLAERRWRSQPNPFRWMPAFFLTVAGALLLWRTLHGIGTPFDSRKHLFPTHLRIDSLLFGVLLSYYYHYRREATMAFFRRYRWPLAILGLGLISPMLILPVWAPFVWTAGLTCLYLGFGLILMVMMTVPMPTRGFWSWICRAIGFVGAHSYAIYLWHMPVIIWGPMYMKRWAGVEQTPRNTLLVDIVGTLVLGIGLSVLIEVPVLRLRDWLLPSRSKTLSLREDRPTQAIALPATVGAE